MECEWCCSLKPTLLCGVCKDVAYCNETCASKHWSDRHEMVCIGQGVGTREQLLIPVGHLFSEYSEGILPNIAAPSMGTYHAAKIMRKHGMNPLRLNNAMEEDLSERKAALIMRLEWEGSLELTQCVNGFISPRLFELIVDQYYATGGNARRLVKFLKGFDAYILNWGYNSPIRYIMDSAQLDKRQAQRPVGNRSTDFIARILNQIKYDMGIAYRTKLQNPPTAAEPVYQLPRNTRIWRAGRKSLAGRPYHWFAFDPTTAVGYVHPSLLGGSAQYEGAFHEHVSPRKYASGDRFQGYQKATLIL